MSSATHGAERWRVAAFAAIGYAYIVGVLASLIALTIFLARYGIFRGPAWIPAGVVVLVVSALWVKVEPPKGRPLALAEAPRLFALINEVRDALGAPDCDTVVLTAEVNAAVLDLPRLVFFGSRRYLIVGLPLLAILSEPEFRAILAHEFAHLSRRHGRHRVRAARLQTTWATLAFHVQWTRNWVAFAFVPFFRWYAPRFYAMVENMSRGQELESDRLAAALAGPEASATALVRLSLGGAFAQRVVWPGILRDSADRDTPPEDAVTRLVAGTQGHLDHPDAAGLARMLLESGSMERDSHPSLADRLAALHHPVTPGDAAELLAGLGAEHAANAAEALLGGPEVVSALGRDLGRVWAVSIRSAWRKLHAGASAWREAEPGSDDGLWARARWSAACEAPDTAISLLRRALELVPHRAEARALLGQLLVNQPGQTEWHEGQVLLEEAVAEDSAFALAAVEALQRHYARAGRVQELRRCAQREAQLQAARLRSLRERGVLQFSDMMRPYPVSPPALAGIRDRLESHPNIVSAFLVQKQTRHLAATPVAFLVVQFRTPWYKPAGGRAEQRVNQELANEVALPDGIDLTVLHVERGSRLLRRLRRLPGAEIHRGDGASGGPPGVVAAEWSRPPLVWRLLQWPVVVPVLLAALAVTFFVLAHVTDRPRRTDYAARLPQLRAAVRRNPDDPRANLELTWALIDSGRLDEALPVAGTAARLNPGDAYAHNSLGWLLSRHGRFAEAIASFQTALRLNPDHEYAHQNLGWALFKLRRVDEAEAEYRQALRITPGNASAHLERGMVLVELRRFEDGEREMREAIRREPTRASFRAVLGFALKRQSRLDEASAAFRQAARLDPRSARWWLEIGMLEHLQGRHAQAVAAFREVERLDPQLLHRSEAARAMLAASSAGRTLQ